MSDKNQKLNLYRVTRHYHTNGSVTVKAKNKEEAISMANGGMIDSDELLDGLQEHDMPDCELLEENVQLESDAKEVGERRVKVEVVVDEYYVADTLRAIANIIEDTDILDPLYNRKDETAFDEEYNVKFTSVPMATV